MIMFLIHCCTVRIQIEDFALRMNNRNINIDFKYSKTVSLTPCPIFPCVIESGLHTQYISPKASADLQCILLPSSACLSTKYY